MPIEVRFTDQGYLHIPAEVAQLYFPQDTLVAILKGAELWLMPTRGAGGGGLLLKQRNARGDRSVLLMDVAIAPGRRFAIWDPENAALRVPIHAPENAVAAKASIAEESGRWVVYLETGFLAGGNDNPVEVVRHRIADYSSRRDAEVAANWVERGADKDLRTRP
jgi:hypothetical protein